MSLLARLLHQPSPGPTRRAYSSFFSSKSGGGGRYFNSAKPAAKSVVAASKDGEGGGNTKSTGNGAGSSVKLKTEDKSSTAPSVVSTHEAASQPSATSGPAQVSQLSPTSSPATGDRYFQRLPIHPAVEPQDYKLHQFFSLHRPLLMLSQPASSIFAPSPPKHPLFSAAQPEIQPPPANLGTLDDPPEASPEADADAARQLARALIMSRVGGAVSWEDTLKRLGLDVDQGRVAQTKELAREWEQVYMDSTKRKRRKKMKKHKLKKRRKLQRATRLKIGR